MNRRGSATEAFGLAVGHVKTILLQPFDVARWLMLGLIAFLAYLWHGGYLFDTRFDNALNRDNPAWQSLRDSVNLAYEHRVATAVVLFFATFVALVIWVLFEWLSARATFVYIDDVATNRSQLVRPWKEHGEEADSLFFWRLTFLLIAGLMRMILSVPVIIGVLSAIRADEDVTFARILESSGVPLVLPLIILIMLAGGAVRMTLSDFVAPVQYLRRIRCGAAFRVVLGLIRNDPASFILFYVLKILILLVTVVVGRALGCNACVAVCCFCCVGFPIIQQILLQPLYVFNRAFSLFFLQGFGPDLDVFGPGAPGGGLQGPPLALPPSSPVPSWTSTPWPQAPAPPEGEPLAPGSGPEAQPAASAPSAPPESVPLSAWPEPPYASPAEPPAAPSTEPPAWPPAEPTAEPPPSGPEPPSSGAEPDPEKDSGRS